MAGGVVTPFTVSAVAVIAQFAPGFSAQRISSGAPGTEKTFRGFIALRSHSTIVAPKFFIAALSWMSCPMSIM